MKVKQFEMVSSNMAVLATRKSHLDEFCYDRKMDGSSFAWVLVDGEGVTDDHLELMEIRDDGKQQLCEQCFVVAKDACPVCGREMRHYYDLKHTPAQWQECPGCGFVLDMTC